MPTRTRAKTRASSDRIVDLDEAGARVNYSPQYLRKLLVTSDPPPLFKRRVSTPSGARWTWHAKLSELDAWAAARDGVAS